MYIIYVMFRYIVLFCIKELILDNGRCPYKEWFDSLDRQVQLRVDSRLSRFEDGNFGDYRSLKDNLLRRAYFLDQVIVFILEKLIITQFYCYVVVINHHKKKILRRQESF